MFYRGPTYLNYYRFLTEEHLVTLSEIFYPMTLSLNIYSMNIGVENVTADLLRSWIDNQNQMSSKYFILIFFENEDGTLGHFFHTLIDPGTPTAHFVYDSTTFQSVQISSWSIMKDALIILDGNGEVFLSIPRSDQEGVISAVGNSSSNRNVHVAYFSACQIFMNRFLYSDLLTKRNIYLTNSMELQSGLRNLFMLDNNKLPNYENFYSYCADKSPIIFFIRSDPYEIAICFEVSPFGYRKDKIFDYVDDNKKVLFLFYDKVNNPINEVLYLEEIPISNFRNILEDNTANILFDFIHFTLDPECNLTPNFNREKVPYGNYQFFIYTGLKISSLSVYKNQNKVNAYNGYFMLNCMIRGDALLSNSHFYFREPVTLNSLEYLYSEVKKNKNDYWFNLILNFTYNDTVYIILPIKYSTGEGEKFEVSRIHIVTKEFNSQRREWIEHRIHGGYFYFEKKEEFTEIGIKYKSNNFFKLCLYNYWCQERCYDASGNYYDLRAGSWLYVESNDEKTFKILQDLGNGYINIGFNFIFATSNSPSKLLVPVNFDMEVLMYRKNSSIPESKYLYNYAKPTLLMLYQRHFPNEYQNTTFVKTKEADQIEEKNIEDIIREDLKKAQAQIAQEKKDLERKAEETENKEKQGKLEIQRIQKQTEQQFQETKEMKEEVERREKELELANELLENEKKQVEETKKRNEELLKDAAKMYDDAEMQLHSKELELENAQEELEKLKKKHEEEKTELEKKFNETVQKIMEQHSYETKEQMMLSEAYTNALRERDIYIKNLDDKYQKQSDNVTLLKSEINRLDYNIKNYQRIIEESENKIENLKKEYEILQQRKADDIITLRNEHEQEKKFLQNTITNFQNEIIKKNEQIEKNKKLYRLREQQLKLDLNEALESKGNLEAELLRLYQLERELREKNAENEIMTLKSVEEKRQQLEKLNETQKNLSREKEINDANEKEINRLNSLLEQMQIQIKNLTDRKEVLEKNEIASRKLLNESAERFANELQNAKDEYMKKYTNLRRQIDQRDVEIQSLKIYKDGLNPQYITATNQGINNQQIQYGLNEQQTPEVKKGFKDGSQKKGTKRRKEALKKKKEKQLLEADEEIEKEEVETIDQGEIIDDKQKKPIQFKDKNIDFYKILDGVISEKEDVKTKTNIDKHIDTESNDESSLTDGSELYNEWSNILNTIDNRGKLNIVKTRVEQSVKNTPFSLSSMKENMFSLPGIFFNIYQIIANKSEFYYLCVFPIVLYNRIEFTENIYNPQSINISDLERDFRKIEHHMKSKEVVDECELVREKLGAKGTRYNTVSFKKMTKNFEFLGLKFEEEIPRLVSILLQKLLELNDHSLLLSTLICCYHAYNLSCIKTLINNENANTYLGYNAKNHQFLITRRSIETFTSVSTMYPTPKTSSRIFKKDKEKIFLRLKKNIEEDICLYYVNFGKNNNDILYKKFDIFISTTESDQFINSKDAYDEAIKQHLVSSKNFQPVPLLKQLKFICMDEEDKLYKKIFDIILEHSSTFDKIIVPYRFSNRDSESVLEICSESFYSIQYSMWIYFNEIHTFICEGYNSIIDKDKELPITLVELSDEDKIMDSMGDMRFVRSNIYTIKLDGEHYNLLMTPNIRYLYNTDKRNDKKILLAESQYLLSELLKIVKKGRLQLTKYQDLDFICGEQTLIMIDFYIKKNYQKLAKIDDFKRKFYDLIYIGLWLADQYKKKELDLTVEKSVLYLFYETYNIDSIKNIIEFNLAVTVERFKEIIISEIEKLKIGFDKDDSQMYLNELIFNNHTVIKKDDDLIIFTPIILAEMYFKTSNQALSFMVFFINFLNLQFSRYTLKRGNNYGPLNSEWLNIENNLKGKTNYYYDIFRNNSYDVLLNKIKKKIDESKGSKVKQDLERTYGFGTMNKFNFNWSVSLFTNSISTRVICENYTLFEGLQINSETKDPEIEKKKNELEKLKNSSRSGTLGDYDKRNMSVIQRSLNIYEKRKDSLTEFKTFALQYQSANSLKKKDTEKYDILNPFAIKTAANSFTTVRFDLLLENYDAHFSSVLFSSILYYKDLKEEITETYSTKNNVILKTFYNVLKELADHKVANVNIDEYESVNFSGVDISGFQKFFKEKEKFFNCISKYYCYKYAYGKSVFLITRDELKKFITDNTKFYAHRYAQRYEDYELIDKSLYQDSNKHIFLSFDCGKNGTLYGDILYYHLLLKAMYMNDYEFIYFLVKEGNLNYNKKLNQIKLTKVSKGMDDININRFFLESNKYFNEETKEFIQFEYDSLISQKKNDLDERFNKSKEKLIDAIKKVSSIKDEKDKKDAKDKPVTSFPISNEHKIDNDAYVDKDSRLIIDTGMKISNGKERILFYSSQISGYVMLSKRTSVGNDTNANVKYYYTPKTLKVCNILGSLMPSYIKDKSFFNDKEKNGDSIFIYKLFLILLCEKFEELFISFLEIAHIWGYNYDISKIENLFVFKVFRKNMDKKYLDVEYLYEQLVYNSNETIYNNITNYYPQQYEVEDNTYLLNMLETEKPKNATLDRSYKQLKKYIEKFQSHESGNLPKSFEKFFDKLVEVFNQTEDAQYRIYIIRDQTKGKGYMLTPGELEQVIKQKKLDKIKTRRRIMKYYNGERHESCTNVIAYLTDESTVVKEFNKDIAVPEGFFTFFLLAEKINLHQVDPELYSQVRFIYENYAYTTDYKASPFVVVLFIEEDVYNEPILLNDSVRFNISKGASAIENKTFVEDELSNLF